MQELFDYQYKLFKVIALKSIGGKFQKSAAMSEMFSLIENDFSSELAEMICIACANKLECEAAARFPN